MTFAKEWLVGARGLHHGAPPKSWSRLTARQYSVLALCRTADSLLAGSTGGLWEIRDLAWVQRHDETVTEVLAVASVPGTPGVAIGCPYGLAVAAEAPHHAWRWTFPDEPPSPDERFTNVILAMLDDPGRLLLGTEAGVFLFDTARSRRRPSNLLGTPVRALLAAHGRLWAGTDHRGVWSSRDGESWRPAGAGLEQDAVLSLAASRDGIILAGTARGIGSGDGESSWRMSGPRVLVSALGVAPSGDAAAGSEEHWLAGASPGGLWYSRTRGATWSHLPAHAYVRAILAPSGSAARTGADA